MNDWISVKNRLPEPPGGGGMTDTEDYIVFDRTGTPHVVVAVKTENGGNCQEAEIGREDK